MGSEAWWRPALDASLKHRDSVVQESAANAMSIVSKLRLCDEYVNTAAKEFPTATPTAQQGFARTLGFLDYVAFPHDVVLATDILVNALVPGVRDAWNSSWCSSVNIFGEVVNRIFEECRSAPKRLFSPGPNYSIIPGLYLRRYAVGLDREPSPIIDIVAVLGAGQTSSIIRTFVKALDDYTVDERGDVGSWVRVAAITSIGSVSKTLLEASDIRHSSLLHEYLPPALYLDAFAGLLKQGSSRLETVRREAGLQISSLLEAYSALAEDESVQPWRLPGFDLLTSAFLG